MSATHSGLIWHYTIKVRLDLILADRLIKPATAYLSPGEKPAVWFSSNQSWEETANKSYVDPDGSIHHGAKLTTHTRGGGLIRIGVDPETAPHDWQAFKSLSGINSKHAKGLYQAACQCGAHPGEWFVSFDPVSCDKWRAVEVFDGTNWKSFDYRSVGEAKE